jgi:hypothetical protein
MYITTGRREMRTPHLAVLGQEWRVGELADELKTAAKSLPTSEEESRVEKLRRVLGADVQSLTDAEAEVFLTKFNFLLDSWLDEYELKTFNGKTLKQLLREG